MSIDSFKEFRECLTVMTKDYKKTRQDKHDESFFEKRLKYEYTDKRFGRTTFFNLTDARGYYMNYIKVKKFGGLI